MDPCKDEDPLVIDDVILQKCIQDQFPKGEAGRLTREEGIPLDDVQEIRIEFYRIIRIDHLWPLVSLTKLSLSNNLIEKIENLDQLVNLKELDLSFNKITIIENLDALVNIEIFSLFNNLISTLENMDKLKKLSIFSIGNNRIDDADNVCYLRKFHNLKSFNMAGNPCSETEDFRLFVVTFLPQITYYEYVMVQSHERQLGNEIFKEKLKLTYELETKEREREEKEAHEAAEAALHKDSFVEFLGDDYLFNELFDRDPEGKAFFALGDEVKDYYADYYNQFIETTKQIFDIGQEQYKIRKNEVENFTKNVETAKMKNQMESIGIMEDFIEKKEKMVKTLKKMQDKVELGDMSVSEYNERSQAMSTEFNETIHDVWKKLMKLEITLYEQLEEVNSTFEHNLTEMVNYFIEQSQGLFSMIRGLEQTYTENISEVANRFFTTLNLGTENIIVPPELTTIMADKESLSNALGATHDYHLLLIDNREDRLISRAKQWLNNLVDNLQKDEIARSRLKVLDINLFLDLLREEFEEVNSVQVGLPTDNDIGIPLN